MTEFVPGTVWLVGAGPGDPDLLTRKAERLIDAATVIFHDALVGPGVLALVPKGARLVSVGKRSGRHSREQGAIDRLIVEAALAGERVVRLKGGDPAIFGRVQEELQACRAAGVDVHICPGITAASAAAASLSASLTLRGMARKLVFLTAHARSGEELDIDWSALADSRATLAIYMGKAAAARIAHQLLEAGMAADTPAVLIENASLPDERIVRTRLNRLGALGRFTLGQGPALLLIGVAMSDPAHMMEPKAFTGMAIVGDQAEYAPADLALPATFQEDPNQALCNLESPYWEEPLRLQSDTGFSHSLGV